MELKLSLSSKERN